MNHWYLIGFALSLVFWTVHDINEKVRGDGLPNIILALAWPLTLVCATVYFIAKAYDQILAWMIGDIDG